VNISDISELHYITPIVNIPSILKLGILSNREIIRRKLDASSIALAAVQERRESKVVPGAKPLHEYVNLYICGRNPMMYMRCSHHLELCVLRVNTAVLNIQSVVIADGNAASDYTSFWSSPSGLAKIEKDAVFAEWWTDPDQITAWRKKAAKCAEVLVPDKLEVRFILGAYVSCDDAKSKLEALAPKLSIVIDPHMFFRA
jgi:hypothetical protein